MEELKALAQITEQDERNRFRNLSLDTLHAIVASITLLPTVPEPVEDQFQIARNAFVYSYFFFPFTSAAALYSILAIELALNIRIGQLKPELFERGRKPMLAELLGVAVRARLLLDAGFDVQYPDDRVVNIDEGNPHAPAAPFDQRYCYVMLKRLPRLRNDLAHGARVLRPGVSHELARAAELINQLFPAGAVGQK